MGSLRRTVLGASVLGVLTCVAALAASLAFASPALAECPSEALRRESNTNPTTGRPYSEGLPDCRGYEMVSPLYKQAQNVNAVPEGGVLAAAPGGETAGWASLGNFSGPENHTIFGNVFLSQRGGSGWITSSAFAPHSLVDVPYKGGLEGDSAPDLRSVRASCGTTPPSKGERGEGSYTLVCARREGEAAWMATPGYANVNHAVFGEGPSYLGGSSDLSRVFLEPSAHLLPADTNSAQSYSGIYELAGCCTAASTLRLVNVDNKGAELLIRNKEGLTISVAGPLIGDTGFVPAVLGSRYHAISTSGRTVFFTATPNEPGEEEIQTVYARIHCVLTTQNESTCKDGGNGESFETVAVSNPSHGECETCNVGEERSNATFQGASADGSKVFFTTEQELLDLDHTYNLYEYDFNRPQGERLVLLSRDEEGAKVSGVVRSSADGSQVYFVATGALKVEKNANGEEANGNGEKPVKGMSNLYGYDTATGEIKFVAGGQSAGEVVGGVSAHGSTESLDSAREAQTTPNGRYLVFSSPLKVSGDTNSGPQTVYRYDFQTGALEWVSHVAPGFAAKNEGQPALVTPVPGTVLGTYANIDDWARAISENGEYITFTTGEKLQASDVNNASDVYEWHNGTVTMISDGHNEGGVGQKETVMSASGSDVFFLTRTQLVGQDTDVLRDLYDAHIGGGFPRPNEASCSGEACQGPLSPPPSLPSAASSLFTGGQNLAPPLISAATPTNTKPKPKPLTRAQLLAKALKACKGKAKRKRALCESQARRKYASKANANKRVRTGR
jgi:hypothetical protein